MGKHVHRLSNVDREAMTADCAHCGPVRLRRKSGGRVTCAMAARRWDHAPGTRDRQGEGAGVWRRFCKDACERCGFAPGDKRMLDVHHRDRDRANNVEGNLETLCPNCHRAEHLD